MKVFNIGHSEVQIIVDALEYYGGAYELQARNEESKEIREAAEYEAAHIRTTHTLLKDMRLQELCERCLSYFWDMYVEMGCFCDELEDLADDMGITEEELKGLFLEAGYEDIELIEDDEEDEY